MKEKGLRRSKCKKITLRQTYYLLPAKKVVVVTTKKHLTTFFPFIVNYLQRDGFVVR